MQKLPQVIGVQEAHCDQYQVQEEFHCVQRDVQQSRPVPRTKLAPTAKDGEAVVRADCLEREQHDEVYGRERPYLSPCTQLLLFAPCLESHVDRKVLQHEDIDHEERGLSGEKDHVIENIRFEKKATLVAPDQDYCKEQKGKCVFEKRHK